VAIPGCPVQRFRICVGNRPEDIQQWIAERKKRFPRLLVPKQEPLNDFRDAGQTENNTQQRDTTLHGSTAAAAAAKHGESEEEGKGLSSLLAGYSSSSEEEGEISYNNEPRTSSNVGFTPLQETVGEISDKVIATSFQLDGTVDQAPNNTCHDDLSVLAVPTTTNTTRQRPCRFFARNGQCKNGDACGFRHDNSMNDVSHHHHTGDALLHSAPPNNLTKKRPGAGKKATLLQKLLRKDAERERTLTLQLLEHIYESNYLMTTGDNGSNA